MRSRVKWQKEQIEERNKEGNEKEGIEEKEGIGEERNGEGRGERQGYTSY